MTEAVLLNISEMIDLAIGTPEVGVVDFNMLQTVLHCLAQQLRVLGKNVELRGSAVTLPVGKENVQTIAITEYVVDTEDKSSEKTKKGDQQPSEHRAAVQVQPAPSEKETILVVERVKKSDSPVSVAHSPPRTQSPVPHSSPVPHVSPTPHAAPSAQPAQATPARLASTEKLSLVTLSKFNLLENVVDDLKNRVYGSMPKNEEILEEVRSQTNLKAITDMWTSLNVSSRMEAAEAGIAKLSSLVQDLINETTQLEEGLKDRKGSVAQTVELSPTAPAPTSAASPQPPALAAAEPPGASKEELAALQALLARMRTDLDHLSSAFYTTVEEIQVSLDKPLAVPLPPPPPPPLEASATTGATVAPTPAAEVAAVPLTLPASDRRHSRGSISIMTAGLMDRINELEKKLKKCCDSIGQNDGALQDQMNSLQDQLEYQMKQLSTLQQDLAGGTLSPDLIKDLQGLMALFKTVQDMQEQLKQVHETALQLATEKEDRQSNMNALLEQIELLKTIKLDREDMLEAMAEKADLRMLARKVSHDQFELACDDLSRGLEHALGKLNIQEALWQQALDDIQREIETKLDKMELSPVKDFFNSKLRQLQDNLKQMASLRREAEAAGTKKKLLRDVTCISCDANAVMKMEAPSTLPISKPLPASLSMKPYLSYELDAIRKTQASNLPQRNMHDWENIDKQMSSKPPQKVRSDTDKHICNRYCGGSHTVTTPAQRVARLGHFVKQWGPEVLPLSSGLAAGDDGRMYKISPVEGANVGSEGAVTTTCTPRPTPVKPELPKGHKPLIISAECHCLEGP